MNDRFLRALRGEKVDRTPLWLMRQAGRYLPEYRAVRSQLAGFMDLCRNPPLACEVSLQPLRRFALDAAIVFSDILTVPDSMGLGLEFVAGEGPRFRRPLQEPAAIERLSPLGNVDYVYETIRLIKKELDKPLIGFCGSPWTLACYMVEGHGSRDFNRVKALMYGQEELFRQLLAQLTTALITYLKGQIAAGADCLMIFDSWGGLLGPASYAEFSLAPMEEIIKQLPVPVIIFSKGAGSSLALQAQSGAAAIGLDWTTALAPARQLVGEHITLQGNMDPAFMLTDPATVRREVARLLADYGAGHRHIFNLGHGITPEAKIENVQALVAALQELSPAYKQ